MRIMVVVTHLLGTGHLARALTLARAFVAEGNTATVVSGGGAVSHFDTDDIRFVQLPPVRSNGVDFTRLLDETGQEVSPDRMARRARTLRDALTHDRPEVVITELFPFGRRILREEFGDLLDAVHAQAPRPLVLSSIRDILAPPGKPAKAAFAETLITRRYDGVLVHADGDLVPLNRSWPVSDSLARRLHYTGFVAPPAPDLNVPRHGEILVSAGGGSVGDVVFAAALDAASAMPDTKWRCLVGGDDARRAALRARAPSNLMIEAPRPDFRTLLAGAAASVSMCGYNTAMDVLQTGVPAVLIPFDDGGEVEQGLRGDALALLPAIRVLRQTGLDGALLAKAVKNVMQAPTRPARRSGMDGATQTVQIVRELLERHKR